MRYALAIIAVLSTRFMLTAVGFPAGDGDLAWQKWLGDQILATGSIPRSLGAEVFTSPGAPWTPQEWLFGIGVALARRDNTWTLFALSVAACAIATLFITAWHAELRGAARRPVAIATILTGFAMFESYGVRAQVVAWLFVAILFLLLQRGGRATWGIVPLAALWSNVHGSAMLAPVLVAAAAAGAAIDARGWSDEVRRLALVALACAVAICCNPFGIGLPAYAVFLFTSTFKQYIAEWQPSSLEDISFAVGALPLLLVLVASGPAKTTRWRDLLPACAVAWLMFGAVRNVAVFAIAVAPMVAEALTAYVPRFADPPVEADAPKPPLRVVLAPALIALAASAFVGTSLWRNTKVRLADNVAASAISVLHATPGEHRVFCTDFAWCSLLLGDPRDRVFMDGRADPFPLDVWQDAEVIRHIRPGWIQRIDRRGVDAIVAEDDGVLAQGLRTLPNWHRAFANKKYDLWLRSGPVASAREHG